MNLLTPYKGLPREAYIIFFSRIINAAGLFVHPLLTLILTVKIGLSPAQAGTYVALSGLIFGPAGLIGGKLSDVVGRKKIIVIFDTLGSISLMMCAFIEPSLLTVYIILAGTFAWGVAQPAHDALLSDITTPENRLGAFSLSYLGFNMGFVIGPALGGLLFENHLKLFFIIDAMTGLIATGLILFLIKETLGLTEEEFDENRHEEKKMEGSIIKVLLSRPILLIFAFILLGYHFVYSQWGFLLPIHIEMLKPVGYAAFYGKLASFNGLVVLIFTPILTSLLRHFENLDRIIIGGFFYIVGFGILGFYESSAIFILSVFIFTIGEILITISYMPFVANHSPASHRGRMSSILPVIMGTGYAIGPIIMGNVVVNFNMSFAWKVIGIVMIISTFLMYLLSLSEKRKGRTSK